MSRTALVVRATPDDVFAVLRDGWLYPGWVVGASRIRSVDPSWPEQGSVLRHSLGAWPVLVDDSTEMVDWSPPHRLELRARVGPLGRAVVLIEVRERGDGCTVRMGEAPTGGLGRLLPRLLWGPALRARNRECLRRLALLAEGRAAERRVDGTSTREEVPPPSDETPSEGARRDAGRAPDDVDGFEEEG